MAKDVSFFGKHQREIVSRNRSSITPRIWISSSKGPIPGTTISLYVIAANDGGDARSVTDSDERRGGLSGDGE